MNKYVIYSGDRKKLLPLFTEWYKSINMAAHYKDELKFKGFIRAVFPTLNPTSISKKYWCLPANSVLSLLYTMYKRPDVESFYNLLTDNFNDIGGDIIESCKINLIENQVELILQINHTIESKSTIGYSKRFEGYYANLINYLERSYRTIIDTNIYSTKSEKYFKYHDYFCKDEDNTDEELNDESSTLKDADKYSRNINNFKEAIKRFTVEIDNLPTLIQSNTNEDISPNNQETIELLEELGNLQQTLGKAITDIKCRTNIARALNYGNKTTNNSLQPLKW